jgi:phosphatidylethanolamine/phosphatidyl-N-methylethanolamine N-methyltransferase
MIKNRLAIVKQFCKEPTKIGAIAASSEGLAARMVDPIDFQRAKVIIEYGCGTGAFTKYVAERMDKDRTTFFSFELNENLIQIARNNIPDICIYKDSAENVRKYLKKHDLKRADAIISGLPWAIFPEELQDCILYETKMSLAKGGYFCTFAYVHGLMLPAGLRFRKKLKESFSEVCVSPIVWGNIPPAVVYWCKK